MLRSDDVTCMLSQKLMWDWAGERGVLVVSDEVIEHYADSYLPANKVLELIDIDRSTLMRWARLGVVRVECLDKIEKHKPYKFYHFGDCAAARNSRQKPRPFLNRKIDGVVHYRCNDCEQWKTSEYYYRDKKNKLYGILSFCKDCHNRKSRERSVDPKAKASWRVAARRRSAQRVLDANAATAWSENPTISARVVLEAVEIVRPGCTDREISIEAGVHEDTIRNIRRKAERDGVMMMSTIDKIFTNLCEPEAFFKITEHLDRERPRWHKHYDYCQMCLRTKIPFMAKGLCSTCYRNRKDPDYKPMVESRWSLKHVHCVKCYTTDTRHAAKGLCNRCYQQQVKLKKRASGCV